jgi:hypothetical protein
MNTEGGKKRQQKKQTRKGGDADGGAIEFGSILAPAILYGLRRAVDPKAGRKMRGGESSELLMDTQKTGMEVEGGKRRKAKRGGATDAVFVSQPSPLEGGLEDVLSKQLPTGAVVPVLEGGKRKRAAKRVVKRGGGMFSSQPAPIEADVARPLPGQLPLMAADGGDLIVPKEAGPVAAEGAGGVLEGGRRRKAKKAVKRGGDKDQSDDDQEGGKKRKAKKAVKRGGDKDQSDDDQDGGKKRKAKKAVKRGGADDTMMEQYASVDQDGGKKRKAKKAVKRGGADDNMMEQYASVDQEGGKRKGKKAVKRGGADDTMMEQYASVDQEGGKRKGKRGGALDLFTQQLKQVTDQLNELMDKK